jgi:predicted transcriptional regulator
MNSISEIAAKPATRFALLTNHAYVLMIIAQKSDVRMREIAVIIGITERAVQRIIEELTSTGYIAVTKAGRRNRYQLRMEHPLEHPVEHNRNLGDLLRFMLPKLDAA